MTKTVLLVAALGAVLGAAVAQKAGYWELMVLDGAPPGADNLGSLATGDLDGDGTIEIVTGGNGVLLWYRPATREKGVIAKGNFHVGVAIEDIDGDGLKEVVAGQQIGSEKPAAWDLRWFKAAKPLSASWTQGVMDSRTAGGPHDVLFADLDGDGVKELLANAMYTKTPGLFIYRRPAKPGQPWAKSVVQNGLSAEGTAVGDLDGDGRAEIISGPYWFVPPAGGPFSGPWLRKDLAPHFREMCRADLADVNGDGRLDAVVVESEYPDGRFAWFENRIKIDPKNPWLEHRVEGLLNFAHSFDVRRDARTGAVSVFVAEMARGGWNPPYNWQARLLQFDFARDGQRWDRELIYQGAGTHQATRCDIDGDGALEVVGKEWIVAKLQVWKRRAGAPPLARYQHRFLDREKPDVGIDIVTADLDRDGRADILTGAWWYRNPGWERREIPGVQQVLAAYDIDGDGRTEIIAMPKAPGGKMGYRALSAELCWLRPVDPLNGKWEQFPIGKGMGDWPHTVAVAPLLPGGKLAMVTGYHSAFANDKHYPEIFEIPSAPEKTPWPKRVLAEIPYGEEIVPHDLDGDGKLDLVAGPWWLESRGDGSFVPHKIVEGFKTARVRVHDVNGDGKPDVILSEEDLSYEKQESYFARVAWFENPGDPRKGTFKMHVIDRIRCPHSLEVADLDGDGKPEILAGEHDPFKPYRAQVRLYAYKPADARGEAWYRHVIDDKYDHHVGAKVFEIAPGRKGIVSHGWREQTYLHLWEAR